MPPAAEGAAAPISPDLVTNRYKLDHGVPHGQRHINRGSIPINSDRTREDGGGRFSSKGVYAARPIRGRGLRPPPRASNRSDYSRRFLFTARLLVSSVR